MSDFDKQLVRVLLRIAQSSDERFRASAVLDHFCDEFSIGQRRGKGWNITEQDKEAVRAVLRAAGIDPATAPSAWDGLARADALQLGRNEKFATGPVQRMRVAVKTLPGRRLRIVGQDLWLPSGCHLDAPAELVESTSLHGGILFVENWENFERIHDCTLDLGAECNNPLVVWRGEKEGTRTDAALWLVRNLREPVWAFVDLDPSGLLIASRLPRLHGVIAPPEDVLERELAEGIRDRFEDQLPGAGAALDACEHTEIRRLWAILLRHGRALPQERYLRARDS